MKLNLFFSIAFFSIIFISCKTTPKPVPALFSLMDSTGINFVNKVEDDKKENSFVFRNFYNGGGVAIGDINNDGLPDVFLTSNAGANKLYLNKGNFKFDDISDKAGIIKDSMWNTGVTFADLNGDGWLDIYVSTAGHMGTGSRKNKLYINNHDLTFTESAAKYGLDISAYTTQVSFFDYDGDGDLDCFMINNSPIPVNQLKYSNRRDLPEKEWPVADFLKGGGDHLYRNDNGHFTEVTKQAGIHGSLISFGLGVSVADINGDGWPDVFVSNDSYERDYLYINQKNGTFKDELEDKIQHTSFSSMGADIADINNDGYPDLFTTDMYPVNDLRLKTTGSFDNIDLFNQKLKSGFYYQYMKNCLQVNNQNGTFSELANYSCVKATDWSWGALMFDMDNDGYNDLLVCNGVNRDVTNLDFMDFFADETFHKMALNGEKKDIQELVSKIPRTPLPNMVYHNDKNFKFSDVGAAWGLGQPTWSNGAAYADLDGDGDLDLIVSNENQPSFVYRNNSREMNKNNYLGIMLQGKGMNSFAIGSKILVYADNQIFNREVVPSRGFQSSVDYKQIIGLGTISKIDSMVVIWPDRTYKKIFSPTVNQVINLAQGNEKNNISELKKSLPNPIYSQEKNTNFQRCTEDSAIDFYNERSIPRMLSREGPKAAIADVNGDGLADVYIGAAAHQQGGHLYLQTADGKFVEKPEPDFKKFMDFEDVSNVFFDADGDGDLDLFVGAGGNMSPQNSRELQHRLYKNDGKGNFTIDVTAFPMNQDNTGAAAVYDVDHDGNLDIFVGARNVTQQYGVTPQSHFYMNDGKGHFTALDKTKMGGLDSVGMVTSAVWADVSGDADKELIVVGEWMYPHVYSFKKDHFEEIKTSLSDKFGWWQTVTAADLDGDGKMDLVLGNMGENFYLHPDTTHPVKLWLNDFDQNNSIDKVLTSTVDGKDLPIFLKHEMEEQIPGLKKQNLKHAVYATKSVQELFNEKLMDASIKRTFNYTSNCMAFNKGNGNFEVKVLPPRMQLSSVNAVVVTDVNNDGKPDLICGGNMDYFIPQLERLDASFGDVLINDGKGNFTWQGSNWSGILQRGCVKDMAEIKGKKTNYLLVLQNDDFPVLYRKK